MKKIEPLISQANFLIDKSAQLCYVEKELRPCVEMLCNLKSLDSENWLSEIKALFKRIIFMDKSTGAFGFYHMLSKSSFPFTEELLVYGIDHEPYYNNNDMVFSTYLEVASRNTPIEAHIKSLLVTDIVKGHFFNYDGIFTKMMELKQTLPPADVPKNIEMEIIHSIRSGKFEQRSLKAVATAILLGVNRSVPHIQNMFTNKGWKMFGLVNRENLARENELAKEIIAGQELSLALFYLTAEEKYKKFYELTISEGQITILEKNENIIHLFRKMVELFRVVAF